MCYSVRRSRQRARIMGCLALVAVLAPSVRAGEETQPLRRAPIEASRRAAITDQLGFELNRGQAPEGVAFVARTPAYTAFFDSRGALVAPHGSGDSVRISTGTASVPFGRDRLPHVVHHLTSATGASPAAIPCFGRVVHRASESGVEASWRLRGGLVELVLEVAPASRDEDISITLDGVSDLVLRDGAAEAAAGRGRVRLSAPVAWQECELGREPVAVEYVLRGDERLGFRVGAHDDTRPLWIDPQIEYLSYFAYAAADGEFGRLTADSQGRAVVVMQTNNEELPTTDGAFQEEPANDPLSFVDTFVVKFDAALEEIVWATYFGGTGADQTWDVAIGSDDSVYLGGLTTSEDLPLENPALSELTDDSNGFISRLSADGSSLLSSTYVDGSRVSDIAIGPDGQIAAVVGDIDAAFDLFSADGSEREWHYQLDYDDTETTQPRTRWSDVAVDLDGNVIISGAAYAKAGGQDGYLSPTEGAYQETYGGGGDGFIGKLSWDGELQWLTYFGGSGGEIIYEVETDPIGMIVVIGHTSSSDFPRTDGEDETDIAGLVDTFVARLTPDGGALRMSTLITSPDGIDSVHKVEIEHNARIVVAGLTDSTEFPVTNAVVESPFGNDEVWVAEMSPFGDVDFSSYACRGSPDEWSPEIALDALGGLHIIAQSTARDSPTTEGVYQEELPLLQRDKLLITKFSGVLSTTEFPMSLTVVTPPATQGRPYSAQFTTSGGQGALEWGLHSSDLPDGLSLSQTGAFAGTPAANGVFSAVVDVTREYGVISEDLDLVVNPPPAIGGSGLPEWTRGIAIDEKVAIVFGTPPIAITHAYGDLPPGTTFTEDGRLQGTPSYQGRYYFGVRAVDAWGAEVVGNVLLDVNSELLLQTTELPAATSGANYTPQLSAVAGTPPYSWTIQSGQAPTEGGLDESEGTFEGAARAAGTYSFTVRVEDAVGATAERQYSVRVNPRPELLTTELPLAAVDRPFAFDLVATGGTPDLRWSVVQGTMPGGLRLDSSEGRLLGEPLTGGSESLVFRCMDSWFVSSEARLDLMVAPSASIVDKGRFVEVITEFEGASEPLPLARYIELLGGSSLSITVKPLRKSKELPPFRLELLDGDSRPVDTADYESESKKKGRVIKKLPIAETGRYFLRITADRPAIGQLRLDVKVKPPKRPGGAFELDPELGPVEVRVPAFEGRKLKLTLKRAKKSAARPELLSVLDTGGTDLLALGKRKTTKKGDSLSVVVPFGGDIRVLVGSAEGGAPGSVQWSAKSTPGKGYPVFLTHVPSGQTEVED